LSALGTYDFVASACEGSKQAIDAKKSVFNAEAKSGAKSAISECGSDITGYAQAAIDNKKHVITSAAEQAITNKKVSSQEEVRVAILSAYNAYALALDSAKSSFGEVVSSVINQTINLNDATVQYQVLLLSASEAAERLAKTAEVFKDVVFTAERYASTVTDVLAIQRLQENVLDTTKAAINSISQLRNEWADDRKELFETMSDVRKLQDIGTKFDMAYKSLQVALGLTERVQEGIKMKSPEVVY
jgi:DNA repair ATPase RecN